MIHVDRNRVDPPSPLEPTRVSGLYDKIASQLRDPSGPRTPRVSTAWSTARGPLKELFYDKCAYCEQLIRGQYGDVEHFRPKMNAVGLDGGSQREHYWWLIYEWSNLYLSCQVCNQSKRDRFPVLGDRASVGSRGEDLYEEDALLLDPCDERTERDPESHLVYDRGEVYSDTESGRATIDILGLNREELVMRRVELSAELETLIAASEALRDAPEKVVLDVLDRVESATKPEAEFSGMARQILRRSIDRPAIGQSVVAPELLEPIDKAMGKTRTITKTKVKQVSSDHRKRRAEQEKYSLTDDRPSGYYLEARYIERVQIENFRGLRNLDLDLTRGRSDDAYSQALELAHKADVIEEDETSLETQSTAPWTMLLGENATGKSSVLKAIGLAMVQNEYRTELANAKASDYVRRPRCKRGRVAVHLTDPTPVQTLEFRLDSDTFTGTGEVKSLVLGYGATRLLPREGHPAPKGRRYGRIENLFDPFLPVIDAPSFLKRMYRANKERYKYVLDALERLLGLGNDERIFLEEDEMFVRLAGSTVPLDWLSDGYQSLLAMTCDIMEKLLSQWDSMSTAEGVVLLDEIGAHMHPRWRMRIVSRLREALPRVQFIATTHDPLCLRWLHDGEVIVMRRDAKRNIVAVQDELPEIGGLRVDQILASEHFGLATAVDPDIEELFDDYYALLALKKRTPKQEKRIGDLKGVLADLDQLGSTRRERLMLEAIDRHLAREPDHLDDSGAFMNQVRQELDAILQGMATS
ncbi:MAG: AAA family ATPase [bacterium]|nr:AAA family ATPase [bacterium]